MNDKSQVKSEPSIESLRRFRAKYSYLEDADADQAIAAYDTLQSQLTQARKERDEMSAACAVMREALEDYRDGKQLTLPAIGQLLCGNSSKAFLDRMKELCILDSPAADITPHGIECIQQDAQAHLLERINVLEEELQNEKDTHSATITQLGIILKSLPVPDQQRLSLAFASLDGIENEPWILPSEHSKVVAQLTQRDNALKLAGEALIECESLRGTGIVPQKLKPALTAIKALGITFLLLFLLTGCRVPGVDQHEHRNTHIQNWGTP